MLGTNAFFVSLQTPHSLSSSNISLLWSAPSVGVWEFPRDPGRSLSWHPSVRTRDLLVAGPMTYSSSCSWWQHDHSWQRVGSQLSNLTEKYCKVASCSECNVLPPNTNFHFLTLHFHMRNSGGENRWDGANILSKGRAARTPTWLVCIRLNHKKVLFL